MCALSGNFIGPLALLVASCSHGVPAVGFSVKNGQNLPWFLGRCAQDRKENEENGQGEAWTPSGSTLGFGSMGPTKSCSYQHQCLEVGRHENHLI